MYITSFGVWLDILYLYRWTIVRVIVTKCKKQFWHLTRSATIQMRLSNESLLSRTMNPGCCMITNAPTTSSCLTIHVVEHRKHEILFSGAPGGTRKSSWQIFCLQKLDSEAKLPRLLLLWLSRINIFFCWWLTKLATIVPFESLFGWQPKLYSPAVFATFAQLTMP